MTTCMHWRSTQDRSNGLTRRCLDCGATGTLPRCTALTLKGQQCRGFVMPDRVACYSHGPEVRRRRPVGAPLAPRPGGTTRDHFQPF